MKNGFNLTDILMALIVVSVLFVLTIPVLNTNTDNRTLVSGLFDFNSTLEKSINQWKMEQGCPYSVKACLNLQKTLLGSSPNFDQISKFMNVVEKIDKEPSSLYWLPIRILNYYGTDTSEYDFRKNADRSRYLLSDGKIISVETNSDGFWILVDVNGKKLPNRIGKDVFHVIVGYSPSNDINYYAKEKTNDGICGPDYSHTVIECDPENVNPKVGNGASPSSYVILKHAIPDYKALSEEVEGFMP